MQTAQIVSDGMYGVLEVFGPTLEFLIPPDEAGAVYCVMMGSMPPGVSVPLHSHPDIESFFLLSGVVQVLSQSAQNFEWLDVKPGDFVHVPSGAKHAFRNIGTEPAVQLITTTPRLGRFFREVGRPIKPGAPQLPPPTAGELQHFARTAARYRQWLGTPAENAAIGISSFSDTRAIPFT